MQEILCFTAFHGRDVRDVGDFICLMGEREKESPFQCGGVDSPGCVYRYNPQMTQRMPLHYHKQIFTYLPKYLYRL